MKYKLGEIFSLQMGKTPDRHTPEFWSEGTESWISIADLSKCNKYIENTAEKITMAAIEESGIKPIPRNTVIMSFKLSIGKVAITPKEMYSNEAIMAFIDKGVFQIEPAYLYYLLMHRDWDVGTNKAVMGKTLNKATLSQISINIHELSEQHEITKVLDAISSIIEARKQQLQKLDELVKARFVELFIGKGYPTKTIDEVSLGKGEYGAQSASIEYDPTRPRYVRITDINDDGTLNDDVVASINPDDDEQYRLEYGDFLFARMGATVGKTFAFIAGNQIFAGYLIRYKLNQKLINPRYLFWYTKLDEYWNWVKLNQSGAAQPGINAKKYGSLRIPVPPVAEQEQFAAFVEQADKSKVAVQKALDEAQLLFDSLMQKYFG